MWQNKDTAATLFTINTVGTASLFFDNDWSWLDWATAVTGPIGIIACVLLLRKYGIPSWFKELVFWVILLSAVATLGHCVQAANEVGVR